MTVLVTGATGNVGSEVVRELVQRGVPVRAFVRDPGAVLGDGVDVAVGDFADARSLRSALAGVERVFLSSSDGPDKAAHEAAVIDAATAAGVAQIVKASTLRADARSPLVPFATNGRAEGHLRRSGVPATILQSAFYTTNLLAAADAIRHQRALFAPAGDGAIAMIDPRDVAAVAAVALTTPGHEGRTYRLTGPEALSYGRVAETLGVRYVDVPEEAAREQLTAAGLAGWLVQHLVAVFRLVRAGEMAEVTDTVRVLCGRDARSFAAFARERAAVFGTGGQSLERR